jgi:putative peptidoglycan lipid II flippase
MSSSEPPHELREMGRASSILALFTIFSRIFGLVRNQILGHYFGAGHISDAFIAAFTIPNALRRVLGEGGLTPSIVATITPYLKSETQDRTDPEVRSLINSAFFWLTTFITILGALCMYFASQIVQFYVPDFAEISGKATMTANLFRILIGFVVLITWSAFFMGLLNTVRSFALSAFAPTLDSWAVIAIVPLGFWLWGLRQEKGIYLYAIALVIGAGLQVVIQVPSLLNWNLCPRWPRKIFDPRVIELAALMLPSLFILGVYQLNVVINRTFLAGAEGEVSHLFYADLLVELPFSLIATSVGAASITSFSRLITFGRYEELEATLSFSLRSTLLFSALCCGLIFALAEPIVSTIYFSGNFSIQDVRKTASALMAYSIGLPFFGCLRLILSYYFAEKKIREPIIAAFFAVATNAILAWRLSESLGSMGCAIAASAASIVNISLLIICLRGSKISATLNGFLSGILRTLAAAASMIGLLFFLKIALPPDLWTTSGVSFQKIGTLGLLLTIGCLAFFWLSIVFKAPLANESINRVLKTLRNKH